jgi:hypothetical protein
LELVPVCILQGLLFRNVEMYSFLAFEVASEFHIIALEGWLLLL